MRMASYEGAHRSDLIDEEDGSPNYDANKYYPACIGELIRNKYRLISKLGWGVNSTVWLAKDSSRWRWQSDRYYTLKISNCGTAEQKSAQEEAQISRHISQLRSNHQGRGYVRVAKESFGIQGPLGEHTCLVFEPLREPLWLLGRHLGEVGVPPTVLKPFLKLLLQGLDFLHTECHIIHTDLKSDNFLVGFENNSVLDSYVYYQENNPPPYKMCAGRRVYQSRPDFGHLKGGIGCVKISDFSSAVLGDQSHNHDIQPLQFCAPEVLLKATWSYSTDIWNLGNVLWELLADTTLFDGIDRRSGSYSRAAHLAQMIRLLGPPPLQLLERADQTICSDLFSKNGMTFPSLNGCFGAYVSYR
jgi:serine/threonine protein kinase